MAMTGGTARLVKGSTAPGWAIDLYVYYKIVSQNVETNKSIVQLGAYVYAKYAIGAWSEFETSYLGITGASPTQRNFDGAIPNFSGTRWLVENQQFEVTHNADGTKSITINWKWGVNSSWGGMVKPSGSFTITLPTIPRASIPTMPTSFNVESKVEIKTNRVTNAFTHTLIATLGTWSKTLATTVADKYEWDTSTDATALYKQLTTNSGTLKIKCDTYNGSTLIGSKEITSSALVVDAAPIFDDFEYLDTNASVVAVTGSNQVLVKGKSDLRVVISQTNKMQAIKESTPKNYVADIDTLSVSANYVETAANINLGILASAGTKRLNVRAFDSRNNSTVRFKDLVVYDYYIPEIFATISRLNNFEEETTLKVNGKFCPLTINGVSRNTIATNGIQYRYRETGKEWGTWTNITRTISNDSFTCNNVILTLNSNLSYEFEVRCTDSLHTSIKNDEDLFVKVGIPAFFVSDNKKAIGINCVPPATAQPGDIFSNGIKAGNMPIGSIFISTKEEDPAIHFGGTWLKIPNIFILGAGGNYALGSTGGAETVTLATTQIPSHNHSFTGTAHAHTGTVWRSNSYPVALSTSGGTTSGYLTGYSSGSVNPTGLGTNNATAGGTIGNAGGGQSHNNMPPYKAMNIYYRSA